MLRYPLVRCSVIRRAAVFAVLALASCTPPNIAGDPLKTTNPFDGVQCSAVRPQTEPDLMAWDPGSRANLNRLRQAGVVAVRYEAKGCNVQLELLSRCIGTAGTYEFSPYSANEHKVAHNANELFSQLPLGAASLSAKVKGGRALRTDYMLAGQYALPPDATFRAADLRGTDCDRATHVVSTVYVGAFVMGTGETREMDAKATLFMGRVESTNSADVSVLSNEGNAQACDVAQKEGKESVGCAVPLRIGLAPLDRPTAVRCPEGTSLQSGKCVHPGAMTADDCPTDSRWDGNECLSGRRLFDWLTPQYANLIQSQVSQLDALESYHRARVGVIKGMSRDARLKCHVNDVSLDERSGPHDAPEQLVPPPKGNWTLWRDQLQTAGVDIASLSQQLEQSSRALEELQRCKKATE